VGTQTAEAKKQETETTSAKQLALGAILDVDQARNAEP
jgi:hypothetical protein